VGVGILAALVTGLIWQIAFASQDGEVAKLRAEIDSLGKEAAEARDRVTKLQADLAQSQVQLAAMERDKARSAPVVSQADLDPSRIDGCGYISGAGATFPFSIYAKWADAYTKAAGCHSLAYQTIGSVAGIKQIKAKTVTFGATDAPLKGKDLDEAGLEQWPMVMGGILPVVNLLGVRSGDLIIDGPTLAKIFMGKITKWNDPAIKALNAKASLPDLAIAVIHRADGSDTTFNFTNYLSKVSPDWNSAIGEAASVEWPVGIGAKGNDGVANNVAGTYGAIGYVEYAYAKQNHLTYADMINKAGKEVAPTMEAFQAAAANADWAKSPGFYLILTDQPGDQSWPLTAATFILMYKKPVDVTASNEALKFFGYCYDKGADMAKALDYAPMPDNVIALVKKAWAANIVQK
jgi:phosphate transport system substrate-binding protein